MNEISLSAALTALAAAASLALSANAQQPKLDAKVQLAVGGKSALFYLPLTVTERLGYFKDEGLNVEISDFQGGAKSLQALIGGSADVVTGAYDHVVQMHAKNQPITALVELGRFPGYALGVVSAKAQSYHSAADLKGMKIGVTAPGSSTHFMALHLMAQNGLRPDEASFIGVGATSSAVAAVKRGAIDAIVNVDPVISILESQNLVKIVADTRTLEGTRQVFGGPYTAAVLYALPAYVEKNTNVVQALVNALVRGLKWMQVHSAEDIVKIMPEEYALGDQSLYLTAIKKSLPMYSPDGHFGREGAETAYRVLAAFDPQVKSAKIDIAKTYTDAFVDKALAARQ
jgi:NitT/TauT family transport system substrate-binding protein